MHAYITMTAHYLNADWELKSPVLMARSEEKRHTSDNLKVEVENVFKKFEIEGKVCAVVTDNARNITKAVLELTEEDHDSCFAHTLNLAVRSAMAEDVDTKNIVKRVKNIVSYFHSKTVATRALHEVHLNKQSTPKKLKQDVETRWNSTFIMLQSYIQQHEEVTTALCLQGRDDLCLSRENLTAAK